MKKVVLGIFSLAALISTCLFLPAIPAMAATLPDQSPTSGGEIVEPLDRNRPGHTEGTGLSFQVRGSEYLDVTLEANAAIEAVIDSIPQLVTLRLASPDGGALDLAVGGFKPGVTYHLYTDDYHNHTPFVTDASGHYRFNLDLSSPRLLFIQPTSSTIFLGAAGFSKPVGTWNAATRTATLTQDVNETIQIDISSVTLDGADFRVTGTGTGNGVYANNKSSVNLRNLTVNGFANGIYLTYVTGGSISGCTLASNTFGVYLERSVGLNLQNNLASQNTITGFWFNYGSGHNLNGNSANNNGLGGGLTDDNFGIFFYYCGGNTMAHNTMAGNYKNFGAFSYNQSDMTQNINATNLADGKPIVYICNASGQTVDATYNAAVVYLVGCNNMVVKDVSVAKSIAGVYLNYVTNSRIENVSTTLSQVGIYCQSSSSNTFIGNRATNNYFGILATPLAYTNNNQILENIIDGAVMGIQFNSATTTAAGNILRNCTRGIYLQYGANSVVRGNVIDSCTDYGLYIASGSNSKIFGNSFRNCTSKSLYMNNAGPNIGVFNNNFFDNPPRIVISGTTVNNYNLSKPTGGNYFAAWNTPDVNADGFVDTPFVFQTGYQDNLPWTLPDAWLPVTTASLTGSPYANGWFGSDVTLTLTAVDNEGIQSTVYSFDGRTWLNYSGPLIISSPGATTVWYRSNDTIGHVERAKTVEVKIDKTPPAITGAATTAPNGSGWYNGPVTVHFSATDSGSGVASVTPDVILSTEGANLSVTGTATDAAGNSTTATVTGINIDQTKPGLVFGNPIPTPNAAGWNNSSVSLVYLASDNLSGVATATPPSPVTINAEGQGLTQSVTVNDKAGNSASFTTSTVNLDKTGPVVNVSGVQAREYLGSENVTITYGATDSLSGLATLAATLNGQPVTSGQTLSLANREGNQTLVVTATDKAGNTTTVQTAFSVKSARQLKTGAAAALLAAKTGDKETDRVIERAVQCIRDSLSQELWVAPSLLVFRPENDWLAGLNRNFQGKGKAVEERDWDDIFKLGRASGIRVFHEEKQAAELLDKECDQYLKAIPRLQKEIADKLAKNRDVKKEQADLALMQKVLPVFQQAMADLVAADRILALNAYNLAMAPPLPDGIRGKLVAHELEMASRALLAATDNRTSDRDDFNRGRDDRRDRDDHNDSNRGWDDRNGRSRYQPDAGDAISAYGRAWLHAQLAIRFKTA